jgi:hypothetical protein
MRGRVLRIGRTPVGLLGAIVALTIGAAGCVMVPKNVYPPGWSAPLEGDRDACPKLSGTYRDWARSVVGERESPGSFSLARLLTEGRLDFKRGLGYVRLNTRDDDSLQVDILDSRREALILSRNLRPGEDVVCEAGALVFGPFVEVNPELLSMLSPNLGSRSVELRVTAEGALIGVVVDYAAAAIGVIIPSFAKERYWYRWERLQEALDQRPEATVQNPGLGSPRAKRYEMDSVDQQPARHKQRAPQASLGQAA